MTAAVSRSSFFFDEELRKTTTKGRVTVATLIALGALAALIASIGFYMMSHQLPTLLNFLSPIGSLSFETLFAMETSGGVALLFGLVMVIQILCHRYKKKANVIIEKNEEEESSEEEEIPPLVKEKSKVKEEESRPPVENEPPAYVPKHEITLPKFFNIPEKAKRTPDLQTALLENEFTLIRQKISALPEVVLLITKERVISYNQERYNNYCKEYSLLDDLSNPIYVSQEDLCKRIVAPPKDQ